MQLKEFVVSSRQQLSALYPSEEANTIVGVLCTEYLGVESYTYMVNPEYEIKDKMLVQAEAALKRLVAGEPLQYVLGYTVFYGHKFKLNPSVLIPRPETELICRYVIEQAMMLYRHRSAYGDKAMPVRILDLCTGSGCIAWTMALNVPGSQVVGVDISADALAVAGSQNLEIEKGRAPRFVQADLLDDDSVEAALKDEAPFDIIVSNPPYVLESEKALMRSNVLDYEPSLALFVPDSDPMLFNQKIAKICAAHLNTDNYCFVEINEAMGESARQLFQDKGFRDVEIIKDFSNKNRCVKFLK